MIFAPVTGVSAADVPSEVRLFDSRTLYIHGWLTYTYNSSTASTEIPISLMSGRTTSDRM